jgi:serine/threonine protein kinase
MRSLQHANIVGFVDRFDDKTNIYVVMEYASRGDMFDLLEQHAGGVPEKIAARLFHQAVNAVDYIHSKGVLHRDLKPENFFMARDGTVKLGDFGFSNFMTSGGQKRILKTPCGSAVYVAPEIINKEPQGPFVDVWSLGVSLYTLVSAQDPWQKRGKALTVVEQYHLILAGAYNKLPSSVSPECQDLVKRMICVDKARRITLPEALKHSWFKKQGVI